MAQEPAGLILDLRGNPGGYLHVAVAVSSEFMSDGDLILTEHERGKDPVEYRVQGDGPAYDLPLVVLIDGGSASAAEITAGSLHRNGRAVLVGQTTYGKGSVQSTHTRLKMALACALRWPAGICPMARIWMSTGSSQTSRWRPAKRNGRRVSTLNCSGPLPICRTESDQGWRKRAKQLRKSAGATARSPAIEKPITIILSTRRWRPASPLQGSEIKSIRAGHVNLRDSYVTFRNGEAWLIGTHISGYNEASYQDHDPRRERKLLLHRREISRWRARTEQRGYTVIPLRLYLTHNRAKVELGLARGKHTFDKRDAIARRETDRDMQRALKESFR